MNYAEGKRLVEAVCYQVYKHIQQEKAFAAVGCNEPMSFITEDEAADFLVSLVDSTFEGPVNATSEGEITVQQIIRMIEEIVGKKACINNESEDVGPYSSFGNISVDIKQAKKIYGHFRGVEKAFKEVIRQSLQNLE